MADCCVCCAPDKTGGFSCQHRSHTVHRAWHSSESNYKYSGRGRKREGQLMILWALTLRKTLLLLKATAWARTTVFSPLLYLRSDSETTKLQTNGSVQTKEDKSSTAFGKPIGAEWNPPANSYGCTSWHGRNSGSHFSTAWFTACFNCFLL